MSEYVHFVGEALMYLIKNLVCWLDVFNSFFEGMPKHV